VRFDNKHLKSEWLVAGMAPPKPWKDVDLFAVNRSTFGFESKSLQHLCHRLGLDTKSGHYDPFMAEQCMNGDEPSQRTMRRYNVGDVKITEQAYLRMVSRGWLPNHPIMGGPVNDGELACNQCGSQDVERNGWYLAVVQERAAYRCRSCGANLTSSHTRRVSNMRGVR
jgi:DNA-directed RNA polymerase subunit RPC12/RpoP